MTATASMGCGCRRMAAADVADGLLAMGRSSRAGHPGIGRGRSELVISGAAILMTILRLWPVSHMRIADRGLREGILYGLIQARQGPGIMTTRKSGRGERVGQGRTRTEDAGQDRARAQAVLDALAGAAAERSLRARRQGGTGTGGARPTS